MVDCFKAKTFHVFRSKNKSPVQYSTLLHMKINFSLMTYLSLSDKTGDYMIEVKVSFSQKNLLTAGFHTDVFLFDYGTGRKKPIKF